MTSIWISCKPVCVCAAIVGTFSLAFWFKANVSQMGGDVFQYLYSHTAYGLGNTEDAFAPNSINVFLPEQQHPASGLVRTVVSDGSDSDIASYLDSDGTYDNNNERTAANLKNVSDGDWHFVTVTTRLDQLKGFMVYIDGTLAAQLPVPGRVTLQHLKDPATKSWPGSQPWGEISKVEKHGKGQD